jgi:hypothetical protein
MIGVLPWDVAIRLEAQPACGDDPDRFRVRVRILLIGARS